jgi:hypothetical protein
VPVRIGAERGRAKKLTVAWHFSRNKEWTRPHYQCAWCKSEGRYLRRNCRQFPDKWKRRPADVWVRKIERAETGGNKSEVVIASSAECPVSAITPQSLFLIEMIHGSQITHEMTGAALFGPDSGRWPAIYLDAVRAVHRAKTRETEAMTHGR